MMEQVPGQVAVVGGERGRRGGRHRTRSAGSHASGRGDGATTGGCVRADVLQQFVGRAEALATQRRAGGHFGTSGGGRRRLHVAARNYPAAGVRAGHGSVECGHGSGGHKRRQVSLVVALYATGWTSTGRSHHRMVLCGKRQRGRGCRVLLLLAAPGSRAAAHRVFAVGRRRRFARSGRGQRHGGRHPRGAG